jgi:hypothetical protein
MNSSSKGSRFVVFTHTDVSLISRGISFAYVPSNSTSCRKTDFPCVITSGSNSSPDVIQPALLSRNSGSLLCIHNKRSSSSYLLYIHNKGNTSRICLKLS